jgi:hypothetical protein
MQCKDVAEIIEQQGFSPLPESARGHVTGCASCSSLLADFELIAATASQLPSEVEPPTHVWVALRAQLKAENIIREPQITIPADKSPWWQGFGLLIRGRGLAAAAITFAMIFAAGYFQVTHRSAAVPLADGTPIVTSAPVVAEPFAVAASSLDQEEQSLGPMQTASTGVSPVSPVDDSLRENLATLNAFIKECRKRLQEDPNDQVARDYLASAYQQKAEILAAMMERGRSVN